MYNAIAKAAQDRGLKLRIAACFAQETTGVEQPLALADVHMWRLAAQWGAEYQYALDSDVENPGEQENVITDQMILSAVQATVLSQQEGQHV